MRSALALAALLSLGVSATATKPRDESVARVDHVIIGVPDLDQAVRQIADLTGVTPQLGGVHPGRGTRNALMSLGDGTYLELLAPDPAQAVDNSELRELRNLAGPTAIGWAVTGKSEKNLRLGLSRAGIALSASEPGARKRPDGAELRWKTFGLAGPEDPLEPFFIVWADPVRHPSRTSPRGCWLAALDIDHPTPDRIRASVESLELPVAVNRASQPAIEVTLDCPKGQVTFDQPLNQP